MCRKKKFINNINCYYKIDGDKLRDDKHVYDPINLNEHDFENILLDEKSYEDIFLHYLRYKSVYSVRPFCVMFHKINLYIKDHDGVEDLKFIHSEEKDKSMLTKYEESFDKSKYFVKAKNRN